MKGSLSWRDGNPIPPLYGPKYVIPCIGSWLILGVFFLTGGWDCHGLPKVEDNPDAPTVSAEGPLLSTRRCPARHGPSDNPTAERKVGAIISSDVMLTVSTQTLLCPKLSAKKNVSNGKKMHQMARVV